MRENVEDDMTSYFIRTLLSEGRIDYDVTVKDRNGDFTTRKVIKEGPTNLVFTTTQTRVHAENETRVLSLNTNDSDGADRQRAQGHRAGLRRCRPVRVGGLPAVAGLRCRRAPGGRSRSRWSWPSWSRRSAVRLRRDFSSLLALVATHAMLHQLNRERDDQGRIVATVEDYGVVRDLVADVITEGVGQHRLEHGARDRRGGGRAERRDARTGVSTTTQVAEQLEIDKSNAGRRLKVAADGGYIQNTGARRRGVRRLAG